MVPPAGLVFRLFLPLSFLLLICPQESLTLGHEYFTLALIRSFRDEGCRDSQTANSCRVYDSADGRWGHRGARERGGVDGLWPSLKKKGEKKGKETEERKRLDAPRKA